MNRIFASWNQMTLRTAAAASPTMLIVTNTWSRVIAFMMGGMIQKPAV